MCARQGSIQELHDCYNFSFVIPGRIAGMGLPDSRAFDLLVESGIRGILSLTESAVMNGSTEHLRYLHVPIGDFKAPDYSQIEKSVAFVNSVKGPVAVHCFAGIGRTGTILAAYLVSTGVRSDEAVRIVRRLRPGSIETDIQEAAVYEYECRLKEFKNEKDTIC